MQLFSAVDLGYASAKSFTVCFGVRYITFGAPNIRRPASNRLPYFEFRRDSTGNKQTQFLDRLGKDARLAT